MLYAERLKRENQGRFHSEAMVLINPGGKGPRATVLFEES